MPHELPRPDFILTTSEECGAECGQCELSWETKRGFTTLAGTCWGPYSKGNIVSIFWGSPIFANAP